MISMPRPHAALRLVLAALTLAVATSAVPARAAADDDFAELQRQSSVLHQSLVNNTGINVEDRPAIESFRARVSDWSAAHPDHAGAVALELQLTSWLEEPERTAALWSKLMDLRPDDPEIALAWVQSRRDSGEFDDSTMFEAFGDLIRRFPENTEIVTGWARSLRQRMRYEEAADVLRNANLDPATAPQAFQMLADVLYAAHRFDEALSVIESIPAEVLGADARLKREIDRIRRTSEEYVELWATEQALRSAEEAADDLPIVEVRTAKGVIVAHLFENEAPNTVANFIKLSEDGFYDGTSFHRFINDFMIQGGDPNTKEGAEGTPGLGDAGYFIPDEHLEEPFRRHFHDSLAMAKRGSTPNTGGSQFYFNHRPTDWLNGKHTVFGRVVEGRDVVLALRQDDRIETIVVRRKRDHVYEPATLPNVVAPASGAPSGLPGG